MDREASERQDGVGRTTRLRTRVLMGHLLRSAASVVLLTGLYYLIPLDSGFTVSTVTLLTLGLVLFGGLVTWQTAAITRAPYPRLRALEALATAVPLFLVLFSASYFLLAQEVPQSFTESLNRTDALYFTVTVFATVGFGDIAPTTETARALTTAQMIADLFVVGVIAKALFGAVRIGMRRRGTGDPGPDDAL
ncbi:potassium channel family protein [Streptomyces antarcticus]|uniref:potassium channel family protein n=1 Tax=Streptomyces antarcticus TaxID=2996458 RepID=UPI00226E60AF|nr:MULTISPECIES: potassium channel family protein [unclassified Streptomyces]MCY0943053.1 potassium channel family protein [Streptomyces sp. H34-AA3]MCZ4084414.1 potassium channel family protein [Streptomyces sp. H34-S5]